MENNLTYFIFHSVEGAEEFILSHPISCHRVDGNPDYVASRIPNVIAELRKVATEAPKPD